MSRLSLLLTLIGLVLIGFSTLGIIYSLIHGGANAGGYYCLLTLGIALCTFANAKGKKK